MKKISTVLTLENEIFNEQKLTIGVDLGEIVAQIYLKPREEGRSHVSEIDYAAASEARQTRKNEPSEPR